MLETTVSISVPAQFREPLLRPWQIAQDIIHRSSFLSQGDASQSGLFFFKLYLFVVVGVYFFFLNYKSYHKQTFHYHKMNKYK